MVFSLFRHIQRSRTCVSGVGCCVRRSRRLLSCQSQLLLSHGLQEVSEEPPKLKVDISNPLAHDDYFNVREHINISELFDAHVHLGHHEGTYEPLMRPYIYGRRAGQHIIDLEETAKCLQCALNVVSHIAYRGGIICFVTTNPCYDFLIQKTARSTGEHFITRTWKKGSFTNAHREYGSGVLPDLIVAFHLSRFEKVREAVVEASLCNVPIVGVVDTDCDPRLVSYPIPANDDSKASMEKLCSLFQTSILRAKERRNADDVEREQQKFESKRELSEKKLVDEQTSGN